MFYFGISLGAHNYLFRQKKEKNPYKAIALKKQNSVTYLIIFPKVTLFSLLI